MFFHILKSDGRLSCNQGSNISNERNEAYEIREHETMRNYNEFDSNGKADDNTVTYVGSIILRHITQLICNASAIYEGM